MKIVYRIILVSTALMLPRGVKGLNIWEGTTGPSSREGGTTVTCNEAVGGCGFEDIEKIFVNILKYLFIIAIPIAVGMIVFGAVQMVISGGSPEKAKQGKDTMVKAVIGLVIVLASFLIVKTIEFVLRGGAT